MNEIDKMKTEHARYKKALADIHLGAPVRELRAIAREALFPVQRILPPVTAYRVACGETEVRYEKALRKLAKDYSYNHAIQADVAAALNPPPPAPVTLDDLKVALRKVNSGDDCYHHLMFYQDESGGIYNSCRDRIFSFSNFREALGYLEGVSKL